VDPPHGGTPGEDAAYRAGMVHSRLVSLEAHASTVNGTIKTTGEALAALTLSVNELRLTIKMLELAELSARVGELEKVERSTGSVRTYRRWLLTAGVAVVTAGAALAVDVSHLF
jgi:hypothetical protein